MKKSLTPSLFGEPPPEAPVRRAGTFVRVALNRPVPREFTYSVTGSLVARAQVGARVAVQFAARRDVGVIVAREQETDVPPERTKEVLAVLDEAPVVGAELLGLTRWIATRYACAWGEALAAVLPAPLKREKGRRKLPRIAARAGVGPAEIEPLREKQPEQFRLLRTLLELGSPILLRDLLRQLQLSESPAKTLRKHDLVVIDYIEEESDPLQSSRSLRVRPETLSPGQQAALARIRAPLAARTHATFLLHGVTGSGKTEVYLCAIEEALAAGRGAIVLVPEIALTPQTVGWFRSRFEQVCVLHSRMGDNQRLAEWRRLERGEARVVVGARSAVFAPVGDLGVIVVDEEHEPSFKQESVPRYHARDVAVERARRANAVCLLGSATPALESWSAARAGRFELLELRERVGGGTKAVTHIVDMRLLSERARGSELFSRLLTTYLAETLAAGEQAILFLNRRGFVPLLWCPGCQTKVHCSRCSTALTYHRRIRRLVCHSCCAERDVPGACPTCSRPGLRPVGIGSERVEHELKALVPGARVARMDSDTMRRREDYENTLEAFGRRELDVLVGTQMIAKGLDFPRVTLVGILSADQALFLPDFRAEERTFQLVSQVAGRAGRSSLRGRVVVQTTEPAHFAIVLGARGDYAEFAARLLAQREERGYPPFGRLCRFLFEGQDEAETRACGQRWTDELTAAFAGPGLEILGPSPAPLALLRGEFRFHTQLTARPEDPRFQAAVDWAAANHGRESRVAVKIDVDPAAML